MLITNSNAAAVAALVAQRLSCLFPALSPSPLQKWLLAILAMLRPLPRSGRRERGELGATQQLEPGRTERAPHQAPIPKRLLPPSLPQPLPASPHPRRRRRKKPTATIRMKQVGGTYGKSVWGESLRDVIPGERGTAPQYAKPNKRINQVIKIQICVTQFTKQHRLSKE